MANEKEELQDFSFMARGDRIYNKFNEVELENFMKVLDLRPKKQWNDFSGWHNRLGLHTYEDLSQQFD